MKKVLTIVFCTILLVGITGCKKENKEEKNIVIRNPHFITEKEDFYVGYTLDDGRVLHLSYSPIYKDAETSLGDSIFDGTISIDEVIRNLDYVEELKDGGSRIYKYNKINKIFGTETFYMAVCNSVDGIKDIYITKYKETLDGKCSIKIDDLFGVSMSIKENTLTNTGATVIITDFSDRENIYGSSYKLEKEENGIWKELVPKKDLFFNCIGYLVGEDHTLELKVNWEYAYGKLDSGKYRIIKDTSEPGEGTEHYITAEFEI